MLFEAESERYLQRFVNMDEIWVHHFQPDSKQQSASTSSSLSVFQRSHFNNLSYLFNILNFFVDIPPWRHVMSTRFHYYIISSIWGLERIIIQPSQVQIIWRRGVAVVVWWCLDMCLKLAQGIRWRRTYLCDTYRVHRDKQKSDTSTDHWFHCNNEWQYFR